MNAHALISRRDNRWVLAGLFVAFAIIGCQHVFKIKGSERASTQTAFLRWTPQVRELDAGVNIWQKYNWPATPIMALILKPFMAINPPFWGAQLWMLAKMFCAAASLFLVFRMLDRPEHPFPLWGKLLAAVLAIRPIEGDLVHGNVNLFILLTVVFAVYALSERRDVLAGLSLALGIACKITPALFLPYLVWKRAWTALAATLLGLALWLLIVPGAFLGWSENLAGLSSWYGGMVKPFVVKNEVTSEHQNQSLPGFLERMLRNRPSMTRPAEDGSGYVPVAYHNVADLSPRTLSWILKGCMGAFCLLVIWRFRAPLENRHDWRWVAEAGAIVLGMLIFSERTWKHHAVTLVIPFAVIAHQLSAFRLPRLARASLVGTLAGVLCLMLLTTSGLVTLFGVDDNRDVFGKYAQVYGAYVWSYMLLLAAMFALAGQRRQDPLATTAEVQGPERLAA